MRKTVLLIAMRLDGCIADPQGGVGWLDAQPQGETLHCRFLGAPPASDR